MARILISNLGIQHYAQTLSDMQKFVAERTEHDEDQIWLVQHPPVYTQGTGCDAITLLPSKIPVVKSDRGGQITYHAPGQVIIYLLLNLKRFGLGVKSLVVLLEQVCIDVLADLGIQAERQAGAPGVYVGKRKIAALGLRIKRGCSYHGLSMNVAMDLAPFANIHPCGYEGLQVTQVIDCRPDVACEDIERRLVKKLQEKLVLEE